ncbi:threonine-phosphate decarboxylase [Kurthia zopfii]|uniref:Aminotransferase n=1 Tax=Kurthia zopfii TaxID=1650 RepID=A0A8B4Q4A5_9BACL|nr:histidinol-phosphate transaminase [Kurthia zopfii]PWI22351.1 threonine-phosphate decarboxylase [Kurthia zopfii]TDR38314.1 L-threonine O-3-phosphate decarboxylase [Kurthia zopfii]GEK30635.1 threonine-phosphate decarboxylase [Kurthia zopfii]STX08647.1 Threonine-phosphate decarboxylase [Kurthia zopfii]
MLPSHGANPHLLFEQLKIPMPANTIDFSENVNFAGLPNAILEKWGSLLPLLEKYPHPNGEPFLSKVAKYHEVETSNVFVGNGAAEIFALLANWWANEKVIIVHPTFSEYEATLTAQNAELVHLEVTNIENWKLPLPRIEAHMKKAKAIYLCTPNNPTGVLPPYEQLQKIVQWGEQYECYVVMDEAFIDWVEGATSWIPSVATHPYLIVVRSMTKMYSLAGIRLGYAIAQCEIIEQLERRASHWHINALAAQIGAYCLDEEEYLNVSIMQAKKQRLAFEQVLLRLGCKMTKSVTNYICFQLPNPEKSRDFYLDLLLKGIVVRHTENYRGLNGEWFRIGIKTQDKMARLEQELTQWIKLNGSL